MQSAYRKCHSTETAVLRVYSDLIDAIERGEFALLLDLSAAFDTVDHDILLQRLSTTFGVKDSVLQFFHSYLADRTQSVHLASQSTPSRRVHCGLPQGSVLGPILFTLYTPDIGKLILTFGLRYHCYADDTLLYGSCHPIQKAALKDCTAMHRCRRSLNGLESTQAESIQD